MRTATNSYSPQASKAVQAIPLPALPTFTGRRQALGELGGLRPPPLQPQLRTAFYLFPTLTCNLI